MPMTIEKIEFDRQDTERKRGIEDYGNYHIMTTYNLFAQSEGLADVVGRVLVVQLIDDLGDFL